MRDERRLDAKAMPTVIDVVVGVGFAELLGWPAEASRPHQVEVSTLEVLIGSEFAGRRIEAVAGHGAMGIVYRAVDLEWQRRVALKLIDPGLSADERFRRRFLHECEIAASIRHPNVTAIHSAHEWDGRLYIAMEYIEGTDLETLIAERGALDPAWVVDVISQMGAALDAAHARGLVHRDVKPANVLVATGWKHSCLTDFGVNEPGTFAGTLDYVAPEQIEGKVDARADVYSLGAVLYHALTGQVPYPLEHDRAKMWAHVSQPPPRPTAVAPRLPPALDAVVERAMAKDPSARYPSAGDLAGAAVAAARGEPVTQEERSVATGPAATGVPTTSSEPQSAAPAAPAGRSRPRAWLPLALATAGLAIAAVIAVVLLSQDTSPRSRPAGTAGKPIPIAPSATSIAVGGGAVWVSNENGTVTKADAGGRTTTFQLDRGAGGSDITFYDGAAWVNSFQGTITRVDATSGRLTDIAVPPEKRGGSFTVGLGAVWFLGASNHRLVRIDPTARRVSKVIPVAGDVVNYDVCGDVVGLVSDSGTVTYLDAAGGRSVPGSTALRGTPWGDMWCDGKTLYVGLRSGRIARVDTASRDAVAPLAPGSVSGYRPFRGSVWIPFAAQHVVRRYDEASGREIGDPIKIAGKPSEVAAGDGGIWVMTSPPKPTLMQITP